jgi:deoxyribonuclease-1
MRFLIVFLLFFVGTSQATPPHTFPQAKKIARQLFANHQKTLYCQCQYENNQINLSSCGMQSAEPKKRAHRLEWEHIMPAEQFGQQFRCWREVLCERHGKPFKGRACCEQIEPLFRQMEAELYNLWPSVGLVNQARSNYRFAALGQKKQFFGCDITIDKKTHRVEPSDNAKGIIARANLFLADRYNISLSNAQRKLFQAWNTQFPPTSWELEWSEHVFLIEGYENPYIKNR